MMRGLSSTKVLVGMLFCLAGCEATNPETEEAVAGNTATSAGTQNGEGGTATGLAGSDGFSGTLSGEGGALTGVGGSTAGVGGSTAGVGGSPSNGGALTGNGGSPGNGGHGNSTGGATVGDAGSTGSAEGGTTTAAGGTAGVGEGGAPYGQGGETQGSSGSVGLGGAEVGTGGSVSDTPAWRCGTSLCVPGALCNEETGFCDCGPGFEGPGWWCLPTTPCANDPCQNGGICHAVGEHAVCTCPEGFGGALCEVDCSGPVVLDPVLEAAVRPSAGLTEGEPITGEALLNVQSIGIYDQTIHDFSGLACLTQVMWISFENVGLTELSVFQAMPGLSHLDVRCDPITDLSPLAPLVNITSLSIPQGSDCELEGGVTDLSPLSGLTGLNSLDLTGHLIESLEPLRGLSQLEWVVLDNNPTLSSLSGLEESPYLNYLVVNNAAITSLLPLSQLALLESLYASETLVESLAGLENHPALTTLYVADAPFSDLSPLRDATALQNLWLSGSELSELQPLVDNPGLGTGDYINLSSTPLDCVGQADNLAALRARGVTVTSDCE